MASGLLCLIVKLIIYFQNFENRKFKKVYRRKKRVITNLFIGTDLK